MGVAYLYFESIHTKQFYMALWINISSANGLLPDDTQTLHGPISTHHLKNNLYSVHIKAILKALGSNFVGNAEEIDQPVVIED